MTTQTALCPECGGSLTPPSDALVGELIACDDCSAELEITALDPIALELAPEVQEDWGE